MIKILGVYIFDYLYHSGDHAASFHILNAVMIPYFVVDQTRSLVLSTKLLK